MLRSLAAILALGMLFPAVGRATMLEYRIEGTAIAGRDTTFYGSATPIGKIEGQLYYDTESLGTVNALGTSYQQSKSCGFWLRVGGITVIAKSYAVDVGNNVQQSNGTFLDTFAVAAVNPNAPDSYLMTVNGVPQDIGMFRINLSGPSTLFSSASLGKITDTDFTLRFLLLGDTFQGAPADVTVVGVRLIPTPEPSSWAMLAMGAGMVGWYARRRARN